MTVPVKYRRLAAIHLSAVVHPNNFVRQGKGIAAQAVSGGNARRFRFINRSSCYSISECLPADSVIFESLLKPG